MSCSIRIQNLSNEEIKKWKTSCSIFCSFKKGETDVLRISNIRVCEIRGLVKVEYKSFSTNCKLNLQIQTFRFKNVEDYGSFTEIQEEKFDDSKKTVLNGDLCFSVEPFSDRKNRIKFDEETDRLRNFLVKSLDFW